MSDITGRHLHFDCVSGIAGDMTLGALIDLGVPEETIGDAIAALGLGRDRLRVEKITKSGIAATNVWVDASDAANAGASKPADSPTGHKHHHYAEIRERVENSSLETAVKALALQIFDRVAEAEAKLHGTTVSEVAFHEVGAIDSIVDIVGSAAALHWLSPVSVSASPVAMGRGTIRCAHGVLPVPSPAAVEILRVAEAPVTDGGLDKELCTPTGAAILAATVVQWGSMPEICPMRIGYGSGDIDLPDRPNVLRVILGKTTGAGDSVMASSETVMEIETNIDDMSAELCEHVADALFAAGALDVWWTAITMKKGRPALALRVMCGMPASEAVIAVIFRESSSIGIRTKVTHRRVLQRELVEVETEFGVVSVKVARFQGEVVNAAPEFEACRSLAKQRGVPLQMVFAAAVCAYEQKRAGTKRD